MTSGLQNFQLTTWYKAVIAAATLVLSASLAADKMNVAIVAVGCGVFGVGEWINHPKRIRFEPGRKITDVSRETNIAGMILDFIGVALILFGVYRMMGF